MNWMTAAGYEAVKLIGALIAGVGIGELLRRQAVAQEASGRAVRPYLRPSRVVSAGFVVLALLAMLTAMSAERQHERSAADLETKAACQARFNEAFSSSLSVTRKSADDERAALQELVKKILEGPPGSGRAALEDYQRKVSTAAQVRALNPLPAIPDC